MVPPGWEVSEDQAGVYVYVGGESKLPKASLGRVELIMCAFAATLYFG